MRPRGLKSTERANAGDWDHAGVWGQALNFRGKSAHREKIKSLSPNLHQGGALFWSEAEPLHCRPMSDSRRLEDLAARLARVLPPGLSGLRAELEDNFRSILKNNLERFDLVSRESFEKQAELLAKTQAKLEALEQRLQELESRQRG